MAKPHRHRCFHCGAMTECTGEIEQNHDGFPELVCREYDAPPSQPSDFICEACDENQQHSVCPDCDAWGDEPHKSDCTEGMATPI